MTFTSWIIIHLGIVRPAVFVKVFFFTELTEDYRCSDVIKYYFIGSSIPLQTQFLVYAGSLLLVTSFFVNVSKMGAVSRAMSEDEDTLTKYSAVLSELDVDDESMSKEY